MHPGAYDPEIDAAAGSEVSSHGIGAISAEKRIARLSSLYAALSRSNEAMFREADPHKLCHAVCQIAVTEGGLASASIRLYDPDSKMLVPYCGYGPLQGWIGERSISLNEPRSRAAWSARNLKPYFSNDIFSDPFVAVAREDAESLGVRSSGGLPLAIDGELVGVFSVYAAEPHYFDDEMARLLGEMARNLSFAFSKNRVESALKRSEDYYRTLFLAMPQAVRVLCDEKVVLLNPAGEELFGMPGGSAIGQSAFDCLDPEHRESGRARLREVIDKRVVSPPREMVVVRGDGTRVPVEASLLPIEHEGRPAALAICHDLTQRKQAEKRVLRLTALYAALSRTNEAIFRHTDLKALCQAVCEIAVVHGGLFSAAIRLLNRDTGMIEPYVGHGPLLGRIGTVAVALDRPTSTLARTLREGNLYVSNDFLNDPSTFEGHADARQLGVHAAAVLPLIDEGRAAGSRVGVLSVFAAEAGFFDPELTRLLEEMALNLSFAFTRHAAALALTRSEARYRALFESSPDAIAVVSETVSEMRVVLLNPAGRRLFGVTPDEDVTGLPVFSAIDPAYRETAMARVRGALATGQGLEPIEYPVMRRDGTRLQVEAATLPFDYEGRPAVLIFLRDLSARQAAQQRIGRLASLYAALSRTNEAIFRIGDLRELCQAVCQIAVTDGGLVSASIRAYNAQTGKLEPFTGFGPLSGRLGADIIDLSDPGSNAAQIARDGGHYVCNDIATDPKARASKDDGGKIGVNASAGFALSIDGALAGTLSVFAAEKGYFDTEMIGLLDELARNLSFAFSRQRAAAALRQSEERYRMLFNAAPDAMRVVQDGRVVMFNPSGARLLGFARADEVIGMALVDTIHPDDRAAALERVRIVIEEKRALPRAEQRLLRPDGGIIEAEVISLPFEFEGRPAALTIAHDLTERKAAERAIQQVNAELEERVQRRTAELKQALADLEAFSYTVAHDLRAPLRRMSGFATLLRENLRAKSGAQAPENAVPGSGGDGEEGMFIERITDGVQTMDRLIEGLLDLAQLGRAKLRFVNVDLSAEARAIAAALAARDPHRQAEFVIAPGLTAWADPRFIRDVLDNLIGNAWKFTSAHATARIEFGILPAPGGSLERTYFVRDDGAGFDEKYIAKLYGTFQRLHGQDEFAGTGIGLASVKRIIAHHGGRVWAEGKPEQGATFYFTLPLDPAPQQPLG
jgi:PAS domain S-box-containing protein